MENKGGYERTNERSPGKHPTPSRRRTGTRSSNLVDRKVVFFRRLEKKRSQNFGEGLVEVRRRKKRGWAAIDLSELYRTLGGV